MYYKITDKLSKAPKGFKLYSPLCGECTLESVNDSHVFVMSQDENLFAFDEEGRRYESGECLLFPSKDTRDWDNFYIGDELVVNDFKPFDKVVTRDGEDYEWVADFFSHYTETIDQPYATVGNVYRKECLPFNEETEKLIGTWDPYIK